MKRGHPHACIHANEAPQSCPCKPGCYCKTHTCKRMRKERPTMAMYPDPPGFPGFMRVRGETVPNESLPGLHVGMTPLVPPIRCTITPPCGHCWYCRQAVAR